MSISILIVSWNAAPYLRRCLESIRQFPPHRPHETVVIDNGSTDGSVELVRQGFPETVLIDWKRNIGFAAAVNVAAARATGDYLLLLNSDAEATAGAIDALAGFLDRTPRAAAVAGALFDPAGTLQDSYAVRRLPTLASVAADLLMVDEVWPSNPITRRFLARDIDLSRSTEIEQPAAACLMIRRRLFEEIGRLDEQFSPAWFEDVDLCRRLQDQGRPIFLVPSAQFIHHGKVAKEQLGLRQFSCIYYRNLERYVRKHHGIVAWLCVKALLIAGMLMRIAVAQWRRDHERRNVYAAVLWQTFTEWGT